MSGNSSPPQETDDARSPGQTKAEVVERRHRVAELYLQGWPQHRIAAEVGVDQSTVSRDLKAIQKEWLASSLRNFDELRAQELAKIDRLEAQAQESFALSQQPAPDEMARYPVTGQPWVKPGDPRWIAQIERCIMLRCKLLGLDAPQRIDVTGTGGVVVLAGVDGAAALGLKPVVQLSGPGEQEGVGGTGSHVTPQEEGAADGDGATAG